MFVKHYGDSEVIRGSDRFQFLHASVNGYKQFLCSCSPVNEENKTNQHFSSRSVNVCVWEFMPGTHAVHTAADPKVGPVDL